MSERLTINRPPHVLIVKSRPDGFDLTVNGGGNVTSDEFTQIEAFVTGKPGAEAFITKLQARMSR